MAKSIKFKNDNYLDSKSISHNKKILNDILYPVGYITITSENVNPSNKLGGTWELIDKEFSNMHSSDIKYFTPNTKNISLTAFHIMRSGHNVKMRINFNNLVSLADSTIEIGMVNYENVGVSDIGFGLYYLIGASDGGNGIFLTQLHWETGVVSTTDVVTKKSEGNIASNNSCYILMDLTLEKEYMLDEACDKFYWKRVS